MDGTPSMRSQPASTVFRPDPRAGAQQQKKMKKKKRKRKKKKKEMKRGEEAEEPEDKRPHPSFLQDCMGAGEATREAAWPAPHFLPARDQPGSGCIPARLTSHPSAVDR
ncbi:unnamed protein product [Lota lota]